MRGDRKHILIADDETVSRRMLARTLRGWEYDVVEASDGALAWEILRRESAPRLAILDWMMPGLTGPEVCAQVRRRDTGSYTYILLLTSRNQKADLVEGMEAGADDYLIKPFDTQELEVRLRAGWRVLDLESDLIAAREALRDQATRDPLTWVWNRYAILETLQRELSRAVRECSAVGLAIADLDHFKRINDTCGHLAGDGVLREAAQRMQAALRAYDAVGRYGGEEFLVVLPGLGAADAAQIAERLRQAVAAEPVMTSAGPVAVTLSVGVASASGSTADRLIEAADEALYRAKAAGRNRVELADDAAGASAWLAGAR